MNNRPSDFKDKRVLVLGMGNSAADTSTQLISHAKDIYLSHRGGAKIVSLSPQSIVKHTLKYHSSPE